MSNYKQYFLEAYKKMSLLEKDFDITQDAIEGAKAWKENDNTDGLSSLDTEIETIDVIDPAVDDEKNLEPSYEGKVILECVSCHSKIVVDESKVYEDEETQTACPDIQCPVCNAEMGYTILGKVEPFVPEEEGEEKELEFPVEDDEVEVEEEEEEVAESLHDRIRRRSLGEAKEEEVCPHCGKNPCECESLKEGKDCEDLEECGDGEKMDEALTINNEPYDEVNLEVRDDTASEDTKKLENPEENPILTEDINNLSLDTNDQHLEVSADAEGRVTLTTEPLAAEPEGEMVVPLENTDVEEIEANISPEEQSEVMDAAEEASEEAPAEEEEEMDFDLETEAFNYLGNTFAKKLYENVKSFETSKAYHNDGSFIVEGLLTFNSGKQKPTKFIFDEAKETRTGRIVLEGFNKTFTGDRAFKLRGKVVDNKFISESLKYNYTVGRLNESTGSAEPVLCRGIVRGK